MPDTTPASAPPNSPAPAPATVPSPAPVAAAPAAVPGIQQPPPSPITMPPATPATPPAPVPVEVKVPPQLPKGYDAERSVQAIKAIEGMTPEMAQRLFDLSVKQYEAALGERDKQLGDWEASVKADPKLGGPNYEKTQQLMTRGAEVVGGKELLTFLSETGLIRHPVIVKAFTTIGERMKEDTIGGGGTPSGSGELSPDERLRAQYPSMFNPDGTPKI